jgi:hypothetical protein
MINFIEMYEMLEKKDQVKLFLVEVQFIESKLEIII